MIDTESGMMIPLTQNVRTSRTSDLTTPGATSRLRVLGKPPGAVSGAETSVLTTQTIAIYPNKTQEARFERYLLAGRVAFNRALEARKAWYAKSGKSLAYYDQCADLTALRAADEFWSEVPLEILRDGIRRLDSAFKAFFQRCERGDRRKGYPRFKSRLRWNSFSTNEPGQCIDGDRIRFSKVPGSIRARNVRPIEGKIKQQRIVRRAGKWFCQLVVDDGKVAPPMVPVISAVGVDVGLTTFATMSDGSTISNPRFGKKLSRKLRGCHRSVSRKVKGSNRRRKAVMRLQRCYAKIADARSNFCHHASKALVAKHQLIAVEDLTIGGMVKGRFAFPILDACWATFTHHLTYKAIKAGGQLIRVNPRGTTQGCSQCGSVVPKELSVRIHSCPECGLVLGRDENAARNILKRALSESAPSPGRGDSHKRGGPVRPRSDDRGRPDEALRFLRKNHLPEAGKEVEREA